MHLVMSTSPSVAPCIKPAHGPAPRFHLSRDCRFGFLATLDCTSGCISKDSKNCWPVSLLLRATAEAPKGGGSQQERPLPNDNGGVPYGRAGRVGREATQPLRVAAVGNVVLKDQRHTGTGRYSVAARHRGANKAEGPEIGRSEDAVSQPEGLRDTPGVSFHWRARHTQAMGAVELGEEARSRRGVCGMRWRSRIFRSQILQ